MAYPELNALARRYNTTTHALLLCWGIQQGAVQIPSSKNPERMAMNLAAVDFAHTMSLDDQQLLATSLQLRVPDELWRQLLEVAKQGEALAQLKVMVGANNLPRHRVLEELYQDDALKAVFDFILSRKVPQD